MANKTVTKPFETKGMLATKATKEYREIVSQYNERSNEWAKALSKVRGMSPDELQAEVSAFFLQTLRETDDLATMAKTNIATLTMKEQLKFETKRMHLQRKYDRAVQEGDNELADVVYEEMIELLTDTEGDYKKFNAINNAIKTINALEPKGKTSAHSDSDDKLVFDIKEGIYTEE